MAPGIRIADLSVLPRLGFKGRGTIAAMRARGLVVEAVPNRAFRQADGSVCLVLAPGEVLLLGDLGGDGAAFDAMEAAWRLEAEERTYPMPRRDSHAWFCAVGPGLPEMLAKLCAIDLRDDHFADLSIAQTSVARLNAIVLRADLDGRPAFHLLADSASAAYFLDCLRDAAREFHGRITDLAGLREQAGP